MHETDRNRAYPTWSETGDNQQTDDAGTPLAIYSDTTSSHLASSPHSQPSTWGGARNQADRVSDRLTEKQVRELLEAAQFAFARGWVFQRHWTIHYGKAGIVPGDGARFISRVLDMVAKQARRDGGRMTALWVRECASDKGEHAHILLHLPAATNLRNRTRRWIKAAGGTYLAGVSRVTIIGGRFTKMDKDSEAVRANAANVVRYVLKAAELETAQRLALSKASQFGLIVGKRCGWTQNIGHAARVRQSIGG